jgi:sugar phosphate isomerase/epimerase
MMQSRRNHMATLLTSASVMAAAPARRMTISLVPGSIAVKADQKQCIAYAKQYGFEAVEPFGVQLQAMSGGERKDMTGQLKSAGLVWGAAGLPVDFRKEQALFDADFAKLPAIAKALQSVGVTRCATYILPSHATLTYTQNMKQHAVRLRACAKVLGDHGMRLGLEYVGPKTAWTAKLHPFIHTMAETKDLIGEIGLKNVGFLLDSWHWFNARESVADLKTLRNEDIVSVDLNDAPAGLTFETYMDLSRELPLATGVIDVKAFLNALNELGCDAPVRCEPFYAPLKEMAPEKSLPLVSEAMKRAMVLVGQN